MTQPVRKPHALIVEDDALVRALLEAFLREKGLRITSVGSAAEMDAVLAREGIDVLLLDLGLPDEDGIVVARRFRAAFRVPMMIITAREGRQDRLAALEVGADDYLTKPFDPQEMALRVGNLVARANGSTGQATNASIRLGAFRLEPRLHALFDEAGAQVPLTPAEYSLLSAFANAPSRVLSRNQLLDALARHGDAPGERVVDVVVGRLRKKLRDDSRNPTLGKTVTGFGYMLQPNQE